MGKSLACCLAMHLTGTRVINVSTINMLGTHREQDCRRLWLLNNG